MPGPLPAGTYGVAVDLEGETLAGVTFVTTLVWHGDAGGDTVLMSATVPNEVTDGGFNIVLLDAGLPAIASSCGDELWLEVTQVQDSGFVSVAFPRLSVP